VQVDPTKLTVKAPESKRLKLKYEDLLSNVAYNSNLCRYSVEVSRAFKCWAWDDDKAGVAWTKAGFAGAASLPPAGAVGDVGMSAEATAATQAGTCTRPLLRSHLSRFCP